MRIYYTLHVLVKEYNLEENILNEKFSNKKKGLKSITKYGFQTFYNLIIFKYECHYCHYTK